MCVCAATRCSRVVDSTSSIFIVLTAPFFAEKTFSLCAPLFRNIFRNFQEAMGKQGKKSRRKNPETVKALLSGDSNQVRRCIDAGVNLTDIILKDDIYLLMCVSGQGYYDCVRILIEHGADVNKATMEQGWTPLFVASQESHIDCVRILIENGADINKATNDGVTPLLTASHYGLVDCMRLLIENGADVNKATTEDGETPLYVASHNGHLDCVQIGSASCRERV